VLACVQYDDPGLEKAFLNVQTIDNNVHQEQRTGKDSAGKVLLENQQIANTSPFCP